MALSPFGVRKTVATIFFFSRVVTSLLTRPWRSLVVSLPYIWMTPRPDMGLLDESTVVRLEASVENAY